MAIQASITTGALCAFGRNILHITGLQKGDIVRLVFDDRGGKVSDLKDDREAFGPTMDVDITEYVKYMFNYRDMIINGIFVYGMFITINVEAPTGGGEIFHVNNGEELPIYYGYFKPGESYDMPQKRADFTFSPPFYMEYGENTQFVNRTPWGGNIIDESTALRSKDFVRLRWVGRRAQFEYYAFKKGENKVSTTSGESYFSSQTKKERGMPFAKYPVSKDETQTMKLCACMLYDWEVDYVSEIISSPYVWMRDETNDYWIRIKVLTQDVTTNSNTMQDIEIEAEVSQNTYRV